MADQKTKSRLLRLGLHDLGFVSVEPAAECQGLDGHHATALSRVQAPVSGSNSPENSYSAGPVNIT